jgi:hypothetical protein
MLMSEFMDYTFDELAEIQSLPSRVIPAKAGIQQIRGVLDAGSSPA